jgi:hypothetical protein
MTFALTCPACGAPLAPAATSDPFMLCGYCGSTVSMTAKDASIVAGRPLGPRSDVPPEAARAFMEGVIGALNTGAAPHAALRDAAERHLGAMGRGDAVARVTLALAADFDEVHGTSLATDAIGLPRVAQAYLGALPELRERGAATLHLPFITATPRGPLDLEVELTPAKVTELCRRDAAPPKKKRGWWPFGG